jgi:hypothetical protein
MIVENHEASGIISHFFVIARITVPLPQLTEKQVVFFLLLLELCGFLRDIVLTIETTFTLYLSLFMLKLKDFYDREYHVPEISMSLTLAWYLR